MTFYSIRLSKSVFSPADLAALMLTSARQRILNWRRRQQIISELGEYSPRELAELGIREADIVHVAALGFSDGIRQL